MVFRKSRYDLEIHAGTPATLQYPILVTPPNRDLIILPIVAKFCCHVCEYSFSAFRAVTLYWFRRGFLPTSLSDVRSTLAIFLSFLKLFLPSLSSGRRPSIRQPYCCQKYDRALADLGHGAVMAPPPPVIACKDSRIGLLPLPVVNDSIFGLLQFFNYIPLRTGHVLVSC
jgi:hypothetical protein